MVKRKSAAKIRDREQKWDEVFNALVKLSKNLGRERQFLEDKMKYLHEFIYKMKMDKKFEASRAEFFMGLREKEAFAYKHRYENADNELADFRQWFDYLTKKCEEPKDDVYNNREAGSENKALKNEVRKLKNEIEKCKLDKNSEITALLAEKKFVWHQLKKTEDDVKKEMKRKDEEVKCANEKLRQMVNTAEELQLSHENLKTNFARLEAESVQKSEEILRLCKEIKLLKSRSEPPSTLSRLCSASGRKRGKKGDMSNEGVMKVKTEADNPQTAQKGFMERRETRERETIQQRQIHNWRLERKDSRLEKDDRRSTS